MIPHGNRLSTQWPVELHGHYEHFAESEQIRIQLLSHAWTGNLSFNDEGRISVLVKKSGCLTKNEAFETAVDRHTCMLRAICADGRLSRTSLAFFVRRFVRFVSGYSLHYKGSGPATTSRS